MQDNASLFWGHPVWKKYMLLSSQLSYLYRYQHFIFTDVDECELEIHNCTQQCNNTIGSYICSCQPGYKLSAKDKRTCNSKFVSSNSYLQYHKIPNINLGPINWCYVIFGLPLKLKWSSGFSFHILSYTLSLNIKCMLFN